MAIGDDGNVQWVDVSSSPASTPNRHIGVGIYVYFCIFIFVVAPAIA